MMNNKPAKFQQAQAPDFVKELVAKLQTSAFYGEVSLKFVGGKLTVLRTSETQLFAGSSGDARHVT